MLKPVKLASALTVITLTSPMSAPAFADPLKVVASFSIIADFAKNVGGDKIEITTLVGANGDAHVYDPKPADAVAMSKADVVLVNGLHFEGFLTRLVETSGAKASVIELTKGVNPLKMNEEFEEGEKGKEAAEASHDHATEAGHDHAAEGEHAAEDHHGHGDIDPHAFQSVVNAKTYVANIVDAFCQADAASCETYKANGSNYLAKLDALDAEVKTAVESIPADKRTVITSHDAFGYFEHEYGLTFHAPEGISTEADPSAADVAKLIRQVRQDKASAIFLENITNPRLVEQIAGETGLKLGGELYSDALSDADGPAATYIDLMRHNIAIIKGAITGS
ncbi:metal ABC transporter substrate-binding protein [Mesorhizobium sp. LHD-90]|uniref:metal ABC transporter substrate-binding protein n=1 Tax=Mesorhizobium sp. LHD-90 TaxID=3071414 RepID=UPI0027DF2CB6|nr:metal ABC transporter substrate-binding protein [Mesorhizobium sp. LHD-90]MDQ6433785.1 metal ABC transporter substrate-binding protein [Mesorhizobium sp. LHD-90]